MTEPRKSRRCITCSNEVCENCQNESNWRKRWDRVWESMKSVSLRPRQNRLSAVDRALERAILDLLSEKRAGATIRPGDAARQVRPAEEEWRPLLEPARRAARRLVDRGKIVMTKKGKIVDPSTAKGPVRLRLAK